MDLIQWMHAMFPKGYRHNQPFFPSRSVGIYSSNCHIFIAMIAMQLYPTAAVSRDHFVACIQAEINGWSKMKLS